MKKSKIFQIIFGVTSGLVVIFVPYFVYGAIRAEKKAQAEMSPKERVEWQYKIEMREREKNQAGFATSHYYFYDRPSGRCMTFVIARQATLTRDYGPVTTLFVEDCCEVREKLAPSVQSEACPQGQ